MPQIAQRVCWLFLIFTTVFGLACAKRTDPFVQTEALANIPAAAIWLAQVKKQQQIIAKEPNNADAHFYLGRAYSELTRWHAAMKAYKASLKITKDDAAGAYFYLGQAQKKLGYYIRATKSLKTALTYSPGLDKPLRAKAHYLIGLCYIERSNKKFAKKHHNKLQLLNADLALKLERAIIERFRNKSWG